MRSRQFIQLFVTALTLTWTAYVMSDAGDPEAGKRLFDACRSCHGLAAGPFGDTEGPTPLLGGQHSEYIVMALNDYAEGVRDHAGMKSIAEGLSAQQKQDIGAYLAEFELKVFPVPRSGLPSAIEQKIENCRSCHGERGNSFSVVNPRIIGQNREYLIKVLRDYKTERRTNPTMVYVMKNISEADLARIAEYYSSQPDGLNTVP
jgi:cytochrome c553